MLEDDCVILLCQLVVIVFGPRCPRNTHGPHRFRQADKQRLFPDAIGDELRMRQAVHEQAARRKRQMPRQALDRISHLFGKLSAQYLRRVPIKPTHDMRVEALNAVCPALRQQHLARQTAQRPDIAAGLELNDHRNASSDRIKHLGEQRYRMLCPE